MSTENLPIYPIRTAAELSGVHARRLRAWENVYQLLRPARTPGGHRLFSLRDIERIERIKFLVNNRGFSLQAVRGYLDVEATKVGGR